MRNNNPSQAAVRAMPRFRWVRLARIARLGLGGVIIGSFVGVYLGALFGLLYAAWAGDLSPAFDGALLGGAVVALLGGVYGTVLGVTERPGTAGPAASGDGHAPLPPARRPAATSDSASCPCPPAGHADLSPKPDMEQSHA